LTFHKDFGYTVGIFLSDFITLSKLKQGVIAGKGVQSSTAITFQTFVNLGRMA